MEKGRRKKLFKLVGNTLIVLATIIFILTAFRQFSKKFYLSLLKFRGINYQYSDNQSSTQETLFGALLKRKPISIIPVNKQYSITIPKIGVSVPIVMDVSVANKKEYLDALKDGVAHARGTSKPGEEGNSYLFAHSSVNFWELGKYATAFNLLNKLSPGDDIYVYYNGERFLYKVMQSEIVRGWDIEPFLQDFGKPTLTLQTCDPPGATVNRLLVIGELIK